MIGNYAFKGLPIARVYIKQLVRKHKVEYTLSLFSEYVMPEIKRLEKRGFQINNEGISEMYSYLV